MTINNKINMPDRVLYIAGNIPTLLINILFNGSITAAMKQEIINRGWLISLCQCSSIFLLPYILPWRVLPASDNTGRWPALCLSI